MFTYLLTYLPLKNEKGRTKLGVFTGSVSKASLGKVMADGTEHIIMGFPKTLTRAQNNVLRSVRELIPVRS